MLRFVLKNMLIKSPLDGRIEQIGIEVGESVNALADVTRRVRTSLAEVQVQRDAARAAGIHLENFGRGRAEPTSRTTPAGPDSSDTEEPVTPPQDAHTKTPPGEPAWESCPSAPIRLLPGPWEPLSAPVASSPSYLRNTAPNDTGSYRLLDRFPRKPPIPDIPR